MRSGLADKLAEKGGTGTMTNAEGAQKMKNVWGKPSPWVDYSGTLDGEQVGIAIFDGKQNPKHPTTWHSRDYGLFAANPFGDHDFYNDKIEGWQHDASTRQVRALPLSCRHSSRRYHDCEDR